jgi:hypothetical protein
MRADAQQLALPASEDTPTQGRSFLRAVGFGNEVLRHEYWLEDIAA